ncbi:ABC transporter permease [Vallitalea pronyensis]|uniref:ABC transporter permease n=1 Tax=Vallitalea pronyensis TaxID=1348613 RepID=A0A8J8MNH0_9FIRM|nr:ABC transporter permease [Vallitalea pronyensis]QUI24796.1 ABC transporter permease [Vallitalea pronyensis]
MNKKEQTQVKHKSDLRMNFEKYILRNTRAKIGISIISMFILVAIFAPLIAPYEPKAIEFMAWEKPSLKHPLGCNSYGQDIFSQVVHGARITISVGVLAGLLTSFVGVFVGLYAGYKKGRVGNILMRIVDVFLVLPSLAVMIVLAAFLPSMGVINMIIIIGALSWLWMARSIRSQTLSESQREYVFAAQALGKGDFEIMFKEILPNIFPVVTANMVMVITMSMLTEATLSFLGLGDPNLVSWGQMLSIAFDNSAIIYNAWYWMLPPGLCIATAGYSFMLIGNSFLDIYSSDRGGAIQL